MDWANLIEPLDDIGEKLGRAWSAGQPPECGDEQAAECVRTLQQLACRCSAEVQTEMGQNRACSLTYQQLARAEEFASIKIRRSRTLIDNALRDLPPDPASRFCTAEAGQKTVRLNEMRLSSAEQVLQPNLYGCYPGLDQTHYRCCAT